MKAFLVMEMIVICARLAALNVKMKVLVWNVMSIMNLLMVPVWIYIVIKIMMESVLSVIMGYILKMIDAWPAQEVVGIVKMEVIVPNATLITT